MPNNFADKVSHLQVTSEPPPITKQELQKVTRPMTDEDLGRDYPTKENVNLNDLPRSENDEEEDFEVRKSSRLRQRNRKIQITISVSIFV